MRVNEECVHEHKVHKRKNNYPGKKLANRFLHVAKLRKFGLIAKIEI